MKLIFISMPMKGRTQQDIEQERHFIQEWCRDKWRDEEISFVELLTPEEQKSASPAGCLGMSIIKLAVSDVVIFAPGWNETRGCRVEKMVCELYDLDHIVLGHTEDPNMIYKEVS